MSDKKTSVSDAINAAKQVASRSAYVPVQVRQGFSQAVASSSSSKKKEK